MCAIINNDFIGDEAIETPRLRLRGLEPQDAVPIAGLANDFEVARMLVPLPHPFTLADAEAFVARQRGTASPRDRVFGVEHKTFGVIGVLGFRRDGPFAEVGYWLGRTFWGRGLATEALVAAMDWARRAGARAVFSGHFPDNPASGRVLVKAGFLYTGVVEERLSLARGEATPTRMMVWLA